MSNNQAQWMQYLQNPRSHQIKKFLFGILQHKYVQSEQLIERLSHHMVTDQDVDQFGKMVSAIYEAAYLKAVEDHKAALEKHGLKATVSNPKRN